MPNNEQVFFVVIYYCTCNFLFRNALATLNVALYYLDFNQSKRKQTLDKKDLCFENLVTKKNFITFFRALHGKPL